MLLDIEFVTDIKNQIEVVPCYDCGTKLIFKSVEFDENFKWGEEAVATVDVYCKSCDTYPTVVLQITVEQAVLATRAAIFYTLLLVKMVN